VQSSRFGGTGAANLVALGSAGKFRAALPNLATFTGAYGTGSGVALGTDVAVGVEAYILETGTCATAPCAQKEWGQAPTPVKFVKLGFASDATSDSGNAPTKRRAITDNAKCNKCHVDLGFHGGEARKIPEYCAFCHNSRNVNDERTSQFEAPFSKTPNTVQMSVMIHKIHKGRDLANTYALGDTRDFREGSLRAENPNNAAEGEALPATFEGAFPLDLRNCMKCHVAGGYGLPESNVLPTRVVTFTCLEAAGVDADAVCGTLNAADGSITPFPPDSSATAATWSKTESFVGSGAAHCGSCHDTTIAVTHFAAMTNNGVETCDVCHGDGRFMDPIEIHVPSP
jgi:OmcA/MtrC family decaheme c-type cytochrome